ncbi:MAG: hypothetical protein KatS3mg022_3681 [Armatimonadota bacterium]|nr:MAG: hypothetical protein KatS3mg022_3681 [Armatimonadota bacterium]
MKAYPALRIEGGLFSADLPDLLLSGELPGQKPADFGLSGRQSLMGEVAAIFADAQEYWRLFLLQRERLPESDPGTSLTRSAWVLQLLRLLGYDLQYNHSAYQIDGRSFHLSHRAGENEDAPPVHIVSFRQKLDRRDSQRMAPHSLLQEFLNRSEHLWGIVTNGEELRVLRDSTYVRKQAYVSFDLRQVMEEKRFEEFVLLYRLLHRSRLPQGVSDAPQCLLEQYYQHSLQQGGRVRDRLREGVEACLKILGTGLLKRNNLNLQAQDLYQQLLRLVYRLLFLLVSEERGLMGSNSIYLQHYSISRLRRMVDNLSAYTEHEDLWYSLQVLWHVLRQERLARILGVPPLNGELFSELTIDSARVSNRDLLSALKHLVYYYESPSAPPRRVNYAALDTEELGSVYESLLDFHPRIDSENRQFELVPGSERKTTGSYYTPPELVAELVKSALEPVIEERLQAARKRTEVRTTNPTAARSADLSPPERTINSPAAGSADLSPPERTTNSPAAGSADLSPPERTTNFPTAGSADLSPPERTINSPAAGSADLSPPDHAATRTTNELEEAILSIKVVDPACGSGHFLLAAARRLGKELARVRTGDEEPPPDQLRRAIRDVVSHCIYGVDKNPLAVELCRVALWLESHAEGMPLTFLDHHIRCGDSLLGVLHLEAIEQGIPDGAFVALSHDEKAVASALKKRNRQQREGQLELFHAEPPQALQQLTEQVRQMESIPDDNLDNIQRKSQLYHAIHEAPHWRRQKEACDLWTAAFFQSFQRRSGQGGLDGGFITTATVWRRLRDEPLPPQLLAQAQAIAHEIHAFHWQLEFPEVFAQGGFDVVLGNPPWERIKLQEQEFFASRDAQIARAPKAAERKRMIERLKEQNPSLWHEYRRALHTAESISRFLRDSGEYPLTGRGDINTYSVFAERMLRLLAPRGRAGIIVPTGIATDDTNKLYFAHLVDTDRLVSLYDFENREAIFPSIHRSYRFCLLTLQGGGANELASPRFTFFATRPEHLHDPRRVFSLSREDIVRLNPNTRTLPLFRTRQDVQLTRAIYEHVPVLVNERTGENPWRVSFLAMFHMSNDSALFRTRYELEAQGYQLVGNLFVKGGVRYLPLYEAKMIWYYDHRFGTCEHTSDRSSTRLLTPSDAQHADPSYIVQPWYWVPIGEVEARLAEWMRGWLIGFRDVTNATNERTAIFSLLPRVGVGNSLPVVLLGRREAVHTPCLIGNLAALVFDYVARQKIGGLHMNFFFVMQLPVLPPSTYTREQLLFLVPRVLELVYTAWDVKPFLDDVWRESDEDMRCAIQAQWEDNRAATGGVHPAPPEWLPLLGIEADGLAPFRWDESRRAQIQAELDALYARLYGLTRKQLRYILDPADLTEKELADILDPWEEVTDPLDAHAYAERCSQSDFPGETFRVLKERELQDYGEYRTRRLVLEAWERMEEGDSERSW